MREAAQSDASRNLAFKDGGKSFFRRVYEYYSFGPSRSREGYAIPLSGSHTGRPPHPEQEKARRRRKYRNITKSRTFRRATYSAKTLRNKRHSANLQRLSSTQAISCPTTWLSISSKTGFQTTTAKTDISLTDSLAPFPKPSRLIRLRISTSF